MELVILKPSILQEIIGDANFRVGNCYYTNKPSLPIGNYGESTAHTHAHAHAHAHVLGVLA